MTPSPTPISPMTIALVLVPSAATTSLPRAIRAAIQRRTRSGPLPNTRISAPASRSVRIWPRWRIRRSPTAFFTRASWTTRAVRYWAVNPGMIPAARMGTNQGLMNHSGASTETPMTTSCAVLRRLLRIAETWEPRSSDARSRRAKNVPCSNTTSGTDDARSSTRRWR